MQRLYRSYLLQMIKIPLYFVAVLLLVACNDKSMLHIYDKTLTQKPIKCMKLVVSPASASISKSMSSLYRFDDDCSLELKLSHKDDIHCNSNQNADRKALTAFPQSYLRIDIVEGMDTKLAYYRDLSDEVSDDDLESAFEKIAGVLKL